MPYSSMIKLILLASFAVIVSYAYISGVKDGREAERVERLEADVRAFRQREDIDNEASNLSDVDLCIRLGGVPDECEQLHRVEEANPSN